MFGTTRSIKVCLRSEILRLLGVLTLCFAVLSPAPTAEVKVVLDKEAQVRAWAMRELPSSVPSAGAEFHGRKFSLSIPDELRQGWMVVLDIEAGNVAFAAWDGVRTSWDVKEEDWRIAELEVRATYDGKPAPGLAVLRSKGKEYTRLLAGGSATFFGIPPGEVAVQVRYVHQGSEHETVPQRFEVALHRSDPKPVLSVSLPEPPDGLEQAPHQAQGKRSTTTETTRDAGKWLPILVALVVGLAALVGLYQLLKHHEDRVAESLRRLGVKLPTGGSDAAQAGAGAAPDASLAPAPAVEPITEGIEPAAPGGAPQPSNAASAIYRLVGEGVSLELSSEGEYAVGRDATCDLPITDATVSRRHATLLVRGGGAVIRDEGSTNGTYLNGVRLEPNTEHPLQTGDNLQLGGVKLRVES